MTKSEGPNGTVAGRDKPRHHSFGVHRSFVIRASGFFLHSDFVILVFPDTVGWPSPRRAQGGLAMTDSAVLYSTTAGCSVTVVRLMRRLSPIVSLIGIAGLMVCAGGCRDGLLADWPKGPQAADVVRRFLPPPQPHLFLRLTLRRPAGLRKDRRLHRVADEDRRGLAHLAAAG